MPPPSTEKSFATVSSENFFFVFSSSDKVDHKVAGTAHYNDPKKRRKLKWYGHVSRSSGLAKTILQGAVKGRRRQGRQKKRWGDNIRKQAWSSPSLRQQRKTEKMEETGCGVICSAQTTLAAKGKVKVKVIMTPNLIFQTDLLILLLFPFQGKLVS